MNPHDAPPQPSKPDDSGPPETMTVRLNRRRSYLVLAIGLVLLAAGMAFSVSRPHMPSPLSGLVIGAPAGLVGAVLVGLIRGRAFTYDPLLPTIEARDRLGFRTVHPRLGFDRLEYSPADDAIFEVAADGKRRRLWIGAGWTDPRDWDLFIERFQHDHAPDSRDNA